MLAEQYRIMQARIRIPNPFPNPNPNSNSNPKPDKLDINVEITKLNYQNTNACVGYTLVNGKIVTVSKVEEGLKKDFSTTNPRIVEAFANIDVDQKSYARDVVDEYGILSTTDPIRQQDAANRLSVVAPTEAVANETTPVVQAAQSSIGTRMDNLSVGANTTIIEVSDDGMGVAVGNEFTAEL